MSYATHANEAWAPGMPVGGLTIRRTPALRAKCAAVGSRDIPYLFDLFKRMESLCAERDGLGLAAPQIGAPVRAIVVRVIRRDKPAPGYTWHLNPRIVWHSPEKTVADEGCLSLPGVTVPVRRAERVRVASDTWSLAESEFSVSGLEARVLQHEIDHLDGVLITDRAWRGEAAERSKRAKRAKRSRKRGVR